jgi:hypothetical protein
LAAGASRRLRIEPLEARRLLAVVTVNTEFDTVDLNDGLVSLREAVFATNIVPGPDTIEFAPSLAGKTLVLTQGELTITDDLAITGLGADLLTIDASGNDPTPEEHNGDGSRVFRVDDQLNAVPDKVVSIFGLTLTGGDVEQYGGGGAIESTEDLTLTGTTIVGNSAYSGGGVFAQLLTVIDSQILNNAARNNGGGINSQTLRMMGSTISGNSAGGFGGGIDVGAYGAEPATIESSTISGNSAHHGHLDDAAGGGIWSIGELTVIDSTISENSSTAGGGGIASRDGRLTVIASTLNSNTAASRGGGINTTNSELAIIDSALFGNSAVHGGGLFGGGTTEVDNSTISGNSAVLGGGAFLSAPAEATLAIRRSTVTANSASVTGGVFVNSGRLLVDGAIVAQNSASFGPDLTGLAATDLDVRFSLIGGNAGTSLSEAPIGAPDAHGNLIGGAVFGLIDPLLGALADNGGPTPTHMLLPGSPAIDAGDPLARAGVDGVPDFDQRGIPFGRVSAGRIDLGAYEVPPVEIRGAKWNDLDRDGMWDQPAEPGLAGWTIFLDANDNGVLDDGETSILTGPDGSYAFTDLPAGEYSVAEVVQPNWEQTSPGGQITTDLIVNGGFESGDFTGWTVQNSGATGFVINSGAIDPPGPDGPLPPYDGTYSALTSSGAGTRVIYQDVAIPAGGHYVLRWADQIRNHASSFQDPNQEYRVEIRGTDNQVLETLFSTNAGDPLIQQWTERSADLSAFAGQSVRIAFVEQDSLFYFNVHVDDVRITSEGGPAAYAVTLAAGQVVDELNFGNAPPAEIHGTKWNDLDGDGFWDRPEEPGLAGWTIFLDSNGNGVLDEAETSTVTAADGRYSFTGLAAGDYVVAEVPQLGWVQTSPGHAIATELIVNGDFEAGSLTGWTLENSGSGSFVINSGVLDPSGPDGPLPAYDGTYSALSNPSGPGTFTIYQDVAIPANSHLTLEWVDQIRNHAPSFQDPTHEYRVEIRSLSNQILSTIYSTNAGDALVQDWTERSGDLSSFAGQTIRVAFVVQVTLNYFNVHLDDVQITRSAGVGTIPVSLAAGEVVQEINFGNAPPGEIHGTKWHDLNGDGLWDQPIEPGLEGWTIYLDDNANGMLDEGETWTTTADDGSYAFTSLAIGQYIVAEVPQSDWVQTSPGGVLTSTTELIVNGGFETGDVSGWTLENTGTGTFVINNGNYDPGGPGTPLPPYAGAFSALSNQTGPGTHAIYQVVAIPAGSQLTLEWADQIRNHASSFVDPNQEYRVEIRSIGNELLATLFSTNANDPLTQDWTQRTADLSPFAGQTVRIAFVEQDNLGYFNVQVDEVRIAGIKTMASIPVMVSAGQVVDGVDFGNQFIQPGEIHGAKWNDLDGDGQWDQSGEPGLEGWTIYLDGNRNGMLDDDEIRTVTGPDGSYAFIGLPPGEYIVAEISAPGWVQSSPGGSESADPTELIVNGGFESGDFTGWTVNAPPNPYAPWTVSPAGTSGRRATIAPPEGNYDAWNGFDGGGPIEFTMYQDVSIPSTTAAILSWSDRAIWTVNGEPRTVHVEIRDPATDEILDTVYSFSTTVANGDTGWTSHSVDLSAYSGTDVRIFFVENIPQYFTGPGQIEFDAISLVAVPIRGVYEITLGSGEIIVNVDFGNIAEPVLPGDYNGDNLISAADYTVWRNALGQTGLARFSGADGNGDGKIGPEDYAVWKLHFGASLPLDVGSGGASGGIDKEIGRQGDKEIADVQSVATSFDDVSSPLGVYATANNSWADFGELPSTGSGSELVEDSRTGASPSRLPAAPVAGNWSRDDALVAWLAASADAKRHRAGMDFGQFSAGTSIAVDDDADDALIEGVDLDGVDAVFASVGSGG